MGKHTDRLLRFAIAHPGWHTYGRDASTVRALARLAERGLIIRNTTCRQFRLATPELEPGECAVCREHAHACQCDTPEQYDDMPDGASDVRGFALYVRQCTDAQVRGVYDRERAAGRMDMAAIATLEAARRGLTWGSR